MPKQTRRRPSGSVAAWAGNAPPGRQQAGSAVTVSPSYVPVSQAENSFTSLAASLREFEPSLDKVLEERVKQQEAAREEQDKADKLYGISDRMAQGDISKEEALAHIQPHQTLAYQSGYLRMHGELAARRRAREITSEYEAADKDTLNVDELVKRYVAEDTQGLDDPDYLAGYLPVMDEFATQLKNTNAAYQTDKLKAATESGWMERLIGRFEELAGNKKAGVDDFYASLQSQKKEGKEVFGLEYSRLDDIALEAVSSLALRQGRPELLDVFKKPNADGTPGLYYNPKLTDKVDSAQRAAQAKKESEAAKYAELAEYNLIRRAEADIENGTYSEAYYKRHLKGPNGGVLSAQQLLALTSKADEVRKYKEHVSAAERAIRSRDSAGFALAALGDKGKQITQDAFDKWANDQLKTLPQAEAVKVIVDAGAPLRAFPTAWSYMLKNATPDDAKGFDQAASLANAIYAVSQTFFYDILDNNQRLALMYRTYDTEQRLAGKTPEQALQAARYIGTPEAQERASGLLRSHSGDIASKVQSQLISSSFMDARFSKAKNASYVQESVKQLAVNSVAWGQTGWKDALEDAIAQFKASHTFVSGRWVPNTTKINTFERDALDAFAEEKTAELRSALSIDKEAEVYAAPIPGTSSWGLYNSLGDSLIAAIDLPAVIKHHTLKKAEEARQEQAKRNRPEPLIGVKSAVRPLVDGLPAAIDDFALPPIPDKFQQQVQDN